MTSILGGLKPMMTKHAARKVSAAAFLPATLRPPGGFQLKQLLLDSNVNGSAILIQKSLSCNRVGVVGFQFRSCYHVFFDS